MKYLNNIVEQDHRDVKRVTRPGLRFIYRPTASGGSGVSCQLPFQRVSVTGMDFDVGVLLLTALRPSGTRGLVSG